MPLEGHKTSSKTAYYDKFDIRNPKARNLHMGARRPKDTFFLILVVVSCERIITEHVTRILHNVVRFLGFNWTLFKLDFSRSMLYF